MYLFIKRIFDILFSFILLILTFPFFILIALLIKFEDPKGPVFHLTQRIGYLNKEFTLIKFRSMIIMKERNNIRLSDNERLLKTGKMIRKFSFDELPQMINIIKGDMSFIGPRPLPVVYLPYYTCEEAHRHDMKPGISGWAQINGRNFLSWDEKFKLDLYYITNACLLLDINIFFLTIKKIFVKPEVCTMGKDIIEKSLHEIRERQT